MLLRFVLIVRNSLMDQKAGIPTTVCCLFVCVWGECCLQQDFWDYLFAQAADYGVAVWIHVSWALIVYFSPVVRIGSKAYGSKW